MPCCLVQGDRHARFTGRPTPGFRYHLGHRQFYPGVGIVCFSKEAKTCSVSQPEMLEQGQGCPAAAGQVASPAVGILHLAGSILSF